MDSSNFEEDQTSQNEENVKQEQQNNTPKKGEVTEEQTSALKNVEADIVIESDDDDTNDDTTLNLSNLNLTEIPSNIPKQKGDKILTLVLSKNKIKSLKNLENFSNLERLELDRNHLTDLDDLPKLPNLKTLWLNTNELSDLSPLLSTLQKQCPKLEYLSLLRNPLCPSIYFDHGNESRYKRYRNTILYNLKGLTFLDTTTVDSNERKEAEEKGKFLIVKKPEKENQNENHQDEIEQETKKIVLDQHTYKNVEPAAFLGKGKVKYDGRESEGNRFILNVDL